MPATESAHAIAACIHDGFEDYHARFAAITRRARGRFEQRDWVAARQDAVERIALYDLCVGECMARLQGIAGGRPGREAWVQVRAAFATRVAGLIDGELYKTFYNTLTRRLFATRGVDDAIEFMALEIEPSDAITHPVARHVYTVSEARPAEAFERMLADYRFDVPYRHRLRCAAAIAVRLHDDLAHWGPNPVRAIELLDTVFYRERRAYLVGRVFGEHRFSPCVIALVNDGDDGLRAEAVLSGRRDVAHLFGVSRSYFQADLPTVADAVVFLRSLLPGKPVDEIYTVLGRAKQGKTERYRTFFRHFQQHPDERLVQAEGTPGMVMAVFTLPSYPLVFKLIRDRFAWPKTVSRQDVEDRYALVFNLDRIGRLLDAQPYRHLRFPLARFARRVGAVRILPVGFLLLSAAFASVAMFAATEPPEGWLRLLPSVCFVTLLTLGQMLLVPSAKDLVPRFAEESTLGAHYGALATAGGIAVLAGNLLFGSLLDRALVPSTQAMLPWLLLALFPLCSALALNVICRPLRS